MEVKIQLFARLKATAGKDELTLSLREGATVRDVLARLVTRCPSRACEVGVDELSGSGNIFSNGRDVPALTGLSTLLKKGHVHSFFLPGEWPGLAGGRGAW